jgi:hypothetical protein
MSFGAKRQFGCSTRRPCDTVKPAADDSSVKAGGAEVTYECDSLHEMRVVANDTTVNNNPNFAHLVIAQIL